MFPSSTQNKYWMYSSQEELNQLRTEANQRFIALKETQVNNDVYNHYLSPEEESILTKHYEKILRDFCRKFSPPMPKSVVGTAFQYFKRFYLNNSVMDFHPKHMLVTCVYLAAKVDEFNVSMTQFVANVNGDRVKAADIVLNNELLLMQQLRYHLNVYNPLRPIEGFLIDLKTRYGQHCDPEMFRPHIDYFIDSSLSTDACFLFSPSQIALSAIVYAASKFNVNLDDYLTNLLFVDRINEIQHLQKVMSTLWSLINSVSVPNKDQVKFIEKKLDRCRNQTNNPDSNEYKRALDEEVDEEAVPYEKYAKIYEEQEKSDQKLIETTGMSTRRLK
ncbi:cyclin-H-like [Oppia nitens]|uniref:cyclin-H-like n=1 Tax=Oppia nitens TaxID=1686743 RepID=UPI0023DABF86|nr:cyclin-H-like [Oppia nitens]